MHIIIQRPDGFIQDYIVNPESKVFTFLLNLANDIGIFPGRIILMYIGKILKIDETFLEQNVEENAIIEMIITIR